MASASRLPTSRVTPAVCHRQHHHFFRQHFVWQDAKVDCVGKTLDNGSTRLAIYARICQRMIENTGDGQIYGSGERAAKSLAAFFIPTPRLENLRLRLWSKDEAR